MTPSREWFRSDEPMRQVEELREYYELDRTTYYRAVGYSEADAEEMAALDAVPLEARTVRQQVRKTQLEFEHLRSRGYLSPATIELLEEGFEVAMSSLDLDAPLLRGLEELEP